MQEEKINELILAQREFFRSGATLSVQYRIEALKKLRAAIIEREEEIIAALKADLGKSSLESYMCELGMARAELSFLIKKTKKLAKAKKVRTPMAQFPSKSYQQPVPYGNVLIMSPWNYPFLLTIDPIADAIAAGNTAIVKPSAYSPATSALLEDLLSKCFPPEYIAVVTGGREENAALLRKKFDFIFFTGSQSVGKEVLRKAAEHLTPAVLELGGKSPCIVDETANISVAARRIVFGKYLNCGQTCVAPDYLLCHEKVKEALLEAIKKEIVLQFGERPLENPDYGNIISDKHFNRVAGLIQPEKVVLGGGMSATNKKIEPTLMDGASFEDKVMQEEIFGPILPVLTYEKYEDIFPLLADKQKPLALYFFSEDKKRAKEVVTRCAFGGGCINDTIIHLATSEMGFGGVGESGMGSYHGETGFYAFSHVKSIVDKKTWLDMSMRYQPYTKKNEQTIRKYMK